MYYQQETLFTYLDNLLVAKIKYMNYILYNSNTLPPHILDCISNIRKADPNSNVYLISDKETNYKKVTSIVHSGITSDQTQDIINLNIFIYNHNQPVKYL